MNPKVKVEVVMSDWACESGSWNTENCSSPRHKSFKEPITVSLYEVGNLTTPIATATKNAKIPYRPSADPVHCSEFPGTWYDEATNECFNGIASSFTAKLRVTGKLPTTLIVTVSYPTGSGPSQSLDLALSEPSEHTLGLGSDPTQELFLDSSWSEIIAQARPTSERSAAAKATAGKATSPGSPFTRTSGPRAPSRGPAAAGPLDATADQHAQRGLTAGCVAITVSAEARARRGSRLYAAGCGRWCAACVSTERP